MAKILFILKRREDFNIEKHSNPALSSGLFNSASFMNTMLNDAGIASEIVVAVDNNEIDKHVTRFSPSHVIIEALWVVPSKFDVLCKLHPDVKWIIRLHSDIPFLANESMAMDWVGQYAGYENVIIAPNAPRALRELRYFLRLKFGWSAELAKDKVWYLPNYYPQEYKTKVFDRNRDEIHVGCFGAVRPMKNHMEQAIGALKFATRIEKKLKFHINTGRVEMKGEPVLTNLIGFFKQLEHLGHELVNNEWMAREEFLVLCGQMDLGLQVSFSETFNIVAADLLCQGVPVVGSEEIPFLDHMFCANPTDSQDIYEKLCLAYKSPKFSVETNIELLKQYTTHTREIWVRYFN